MLGESPDAPEFTRSPRSLRVANSTTLTVMTTSARSCCYELARFISIVSAILNLWVSEQGRVEVVVHRPRPPRIINPD